MLLIYILIFIYKYIIYILKTFYVYKKGLPPFFAGKWGEGAREVGDQLLLLNL